MNGEKAGPKKEKARAVVRQLGSNSVPLLLRWIHEEDRPSLTERYDEWRNGIYSWLIAHRLRESRTMGVVRFHHSHQIMAVWALPELDSVSKKVAIAALIPLLGDKAQSPDEMSEVAGSAFSALSKMAPESIDPLIRSLTNNDLQAWALACGALGEIGPEAKSAIPVLEKWFRDRDPRRRLIAAKNIGELGGNPDVFLPIVIQTLPEISKDPMLEFGLDILTRHKEHALNAIPVLQRMAKEVTGDVVARNQLVEAIEIIDLEANPEGK